MELTLPDDLVHTPGNEALWREAYYFELCEPATGRMVYLNFGKLPNRGRSGSLIVVWDPELGPLVGQERDQFTGHSDVHRIQGFTARCIAPMAKWQLSFRGNLLRVPLDGTVRYQEARDIPEADRVLVPVEIDVTWTAASSPHPYDTEQEGWAALFGGHFEQLGYSSGSLRVDGTDTFVDGWVGVRDHSWGARDWLAVDTWRWVACVFEEAPHFGLLQARLPGGRVICDGAVYGNSRSARVVEYRQEEVVTDAIGKPEPRSVTLTVIDAEGTTIEAAGEVKALLPVRFRDTSRPGFISWNDRGIVEFTGPQGRGIGTVEFVSRVKDPR
jgi:hypothetical protein